jgi:Lipid A 3-O-deacylase (PagL)
MKRGLRFCIPVGAIIGMATAGYAGSLTPSGGDPFKTGQIEGSIGQTLMFSPMIGAHRPTVDYTCTEIAAGYMLTGPHRPGFLRGNLEVLGSLFAGGIFNGRGSYVAGTTGWLRYNFLQPDDPFVPFAQIGIGLTESDLDHRIEGENFNFNLDTAVGTRYRITRDWSINLECRYQHISNAHLAIPNAGIDAIGPVLSVSYFF